MPFYTCLSCESDIIIVIIMHQVWYSLIKLTKSKEWLPAILMKSSPNEYRDVNNIH